MSLKSNLFANSRNTLKSFDSQMPAIIFVKLAALAFVLFLSWTSPSSAAQRPNIVMILLDDAGYSDLGVYGSEIETPQIDQLAEEGVLFTQFHVTPTCSSTRASLLTGMDHHRTGFGTHGGPTDNQKGKPGYEGSLNENVVTVAMVLRSAGYHTMMAGKWHMGHDEVKSWPYGKGFDDSFALLNGGASHWDDSPLFPSTPTHYVENDKPFTQLPADFYSSDYFTSKIIEYIDKDDKPFFAFLSFTAPHNPLHAPSDLIEKYKDTYTNGWDALQLSRLDRLKSRGLVSADVKPQPRPKWISSWESLDSEARQIASRDMAIYAAMIDRVDQNVGRLATRLRELNKYDNTLIVVFSDNGASKTTIMDYLGLDDAGAEFLDTFNNKLDNRGLPNSNMDLGPGWAYGVSAPFRLMKGYQTQGGVASPLIVKPPIGWMRPSGHIRTPVHVMDLMPTFVEIAGAEHPGSDPDGRILSMQGQSMVALTQGADGSVFDLRGFGGELFGIRSYRLGDWKILKLPPPYGTDEWQLYNLANDPGETTDLANEHPARLDELSHLWQAYKTENGVVEPNKLSLYTKPPN
jgi:arylsulfatase